jgi:hypothetical protein
MATSPDRVELDAESRITVFGGTSRRPSGAPPALGYSRMKAWISSGVALPSLLASILSKIRL